MLPDRVKGFVKAVNGYYQIRWSQTNWICGFCKKQTQKLYVLECLLDFHRHSEALRIVCDHSQGFYQCLAVLSSCDWSFFFFFSVYILSKCKTHPFLCHVLYKRCFWSFGAGSGILCSFTFWIKNTLTWFRNQNGIKEGLPALQRFVLFFPLYPVSKYGVFTYTLVY